MTNTAILAGEEQELISEIAFISDKIIPPTD